MAKYKTPGVYVEEISTLPPSVAEVSTAIPAFIGYTEKGETEQPTRITSMFEYENLFGGPKSTAFTTKFKSDGGIDVSKKTPTTKDFLMYYSLSLYFNNGGGPCYIVSVGHYGDRPGSPPAKPFEDALKLLEKEDEPTLILLTDAVNLASPNDYYSLADLALAQCGKLKDRFAILDVLNGTNEETDVDGFRNGTGINHLNYGAAYYPYLKTTINYAFNESEVDVSWPLQYQNPANIKVTYTGGGSNPKLVITAGGNAIKFLVDDSDAKTTTLSITLNGDSATDKELTDAWTTWQAANDAKGFDITSAGEKLDGPKNDVVAVTKTLAAPPSKKLDTIKNEFTQTYQQIKAELNQQRVTLPPSAAMAGIYASVDRERGVWKSPANVSLTSVIGPTLKITDESQGNLNIDPTAGKSINAIRSFTGKGTLVWGGRTLAGNDNEWRYINVRRLFNMIEESTKHASAFAVFEANDATTWLKVTGMIESFLYGLWEQGALAGPKPESAYFVNVGLGKTMTTDDVLNGRMIVEIGIAPVRPAEFIILRFSQKMQEA